MYVINMPKCNRSFGQYTINFLFLIIFFRMKYERVCEPVIVLDACYTTMCLVKKRRKKRGGGGKIPGGGGGGGRGGGIGWLMGCMFFVHPLLCLLLCLSVLLFVFVL